MIRHLCNRPLHKYLKVDEEVFWAYRERLGELDDVLQSHVPFPSLDPADIIPV